MGFNGNWSHIAKMMKAGDIEGARAEVRELLARGGGSPAEAARLLGVTRAGFNHIIRKLGMKTVPREIRTRIERRFRLPPLDPPG